MNDVLISRHSNPHFAIVSDQIGAGDANKPLIGALRP